MVVAIMFVGVVAVNANKASAECSLGSSVLKYGMRSAEVSCLQTTLSVAPVTGYFGNITKAAVMAFQADNMLVADGVVGAATKAALAGSTTTTTTTTTTNTTCPVGFTCTQNSSSTTTTTTSTLEGGAGDAEISSTSTDVEDTLKEGEEDVKVLGFKLEADGSDLDVTSVKVEFKNVGYNAGDGSSENFEKYVDEVSIWMGDVKVGSADAEDFSKDSATPDEFSKSISLSGAVVSEDDDAKFYVAVTAVETVDTDDSDDAEWDLIVESVRFEDAEGAILSGDVSDIDDYSDNDSFTFEEADTDDSIETKTSSENPDDTTVKVEEDESSEEVLALQFKLDVDEDSSDVMINSVTAVVTFANYDVTDNGTVDGSDDSVVDSGAENIIDSLWISVAGNEIEADLDSVSIANGAGTATYTADFEEDDEVATISAGDVEDVMVTLVFNDQDNYNEGATVTVSVADEDISAETENDELDVDGSDKTGGILTLSLETAEIDVTNITENGNSNDADDSYEEGTFTFYVTISAEDGEVDVDAASIVETLLDPASNTVALTLQIVNLDGDATENTAGTDYTVEDGDSNTFAIVYTINPDAAGTYYVRLDSIDGTVIDETTESVNLVAS